MLALTLASLLLDGFLIEGFGSFNVHFCVY